MSIEMLSYGEIYQIVHATLRAVLRSNERISSSMAMIDRLFTAVNNSGVKPSDIFWMGSENHFEFMSDASGDNNFHPEKVEGVREGLDEGTMAFADYLESKVGKIYYYPERMAFYVYDLQDQMANSDTPRSEFYRREGETVAHYARRFVYIAIGHERRHSCQSYSDILDDLSKIDPKKDFNEQYVKMPTELDADSFGFFHATDPMGMYHDAY